MDTVAALNGPRGATMKKISLVVLVMSAVVAFAGADGPRYVYEMRELIKATGSAASQAWAMNMGVVSEAARLYTPVSFTKVGGTLSLSMDATMSFSLGRSVEVERSDERVLLRHEVIVQGAPKLPRASKKATLRFSLADLVKNGGSYAGSPLMYALRKAIADSSYQSGRAWIVSAMYNGAGRFSIVVGLSKK
ncbi:MAG: hypothetical protein A2Y38_26485 [Spirochaetes bacterium GWB1_59_5]|nr:MAG: hypothetical protein A2Y38_26485 [Spirochaetes bacterium GWB1_59_5]